MHHLVVPPLQGSLFSRGLGRQHTSFTESTRPLTAQAAGDLVEVHEGEEFPCDLVLLASARAEGSCYVTTANLDGETTVKLRYSPAATQNLADTRPFPDALELGVDHGPPDANLASFDGRLEVSFGGGGERSSATVGTDQLLPQGAQLTATPFILGLAIAVGRDTKLVLNQARPPLKYSSVELRVNRFLFFYLGLIMLMCTIATIVMAVEDGKLEERWYIAPLLQASSQDPSTAASWFSYLL